MLFPADVPVSEMTELVGMLRGITDSGFCRIPQTAFWCLGTIIETFGDLPPDAADDARTSAPIDKRSAADELERLVVESHAVRQTAETEHELGPAWLRRVTVLLLRLAMDGISRG